MALNVDLIIDYRKNDFSELLKSHKIDYVFDTVGKETLLKSISLKPKKIISIVVPDLDDSYKTGMQVPEILKPLLKLKLRKYFRMADNNGVKLIGQVTAPNGKILKEASQLIETHKYILRDYGTVSAFAEPTMGIGKKSVGAVILF